MNKSKLNKNKNTCDHVVLNFRSRHQWGGQDRIGGGLCNLTYPIDVQKKGFSFAEMFVVLVIIGVLAVVAAPIIARKHQKPAKISPHGQFDCYVGADNNVYQRTIIEQNASPPVSKGPVGSASCTFDPPGRVAYFMLALVGAGGGGTASATNCGSKGELLTIFLPEINSDTVVITPGKGGNYGFSTGQDGVVTTFTTDGTISAKGGKGGNNLTVLTEGENSNFDAYRAAGGYAFNVNNSGNGGNLNGNGFPGAALIVW